MAEEEVKEEVILEAEQPEELDIDQGIEPVEEEQEAQEEEPEAKPEGEAEEEAEEDDLVVTIGEDSPPQEEEQKAPEWVRELRKDHRKAQKENRELKEKLNSLASTENKPVVLGKKPTLEDHDYDSDAFERELSSWFERKREHDEAESQKKREQEEQNKAWEATVIGYDEKKKALKVRDYEEAEYVVQDTLSTTQQGMILQGADNPALVVYALGKNQKRAKELASINDPVKFAFAVAKLETQLKVNSRKSAPPPEKKVSGTGNLSGTVDSTLEKLREKAEKSGDYSEVIAYKKNKKAK